jgi:hypothetical protein
MRQEKPLLQTDMYLRFLFLRIFLFAMELNVTITQFGYFDAETGF